MSNEDGMTLPKIISFINMKGGVGKTTLCINVAYTLAKHFNKKVLVLDMDPQFNATQTFFSKFGSLTEYEELRNLNKTIAHVLMPTMGGVFSQAKSYTLDDLIVTANNSFVLDTIPGDLELISFESSRRGSEKILKDFIDEKVSKERSYDYILIDTPATYSIYSQSSLIASNHYVVPIAPDAFSVLGYSLLKRVMRDDLTLKGSSPNELGIIFTLVDSSRVGRENIKTKFDENIVFNNSISEFERIRTGKMQTFILDMESTKEEIINLTSELIDKVGDTYDQQQI